MKGTRSFEKEPIVDVCKLLTGHLNNSLQHPIQHDIYMKLVSIMHLPTIQYSQIINTINELQEFSMVHCVVDK